MSLFFVISTIKSSSHSWKILVGLSDLLDYGTLQTFPSRTFHLERTFILNDIPLLQNTGKHSNNKKRENTHGGVLLLVKLQVEACNFTKINTSPVFSCFFFKLCKWYQTAQSISFITDFLAKTVQY